MYGEIDPAFVEQIDAVETGYLESPRMFKLYYPVRNGQRCGETRFRVEHPEGLAEDMVEHIELDLDTLETRLIGSLTLREEIEFSS